MQLLEFFKLESASDAQLQDRLARMKNGEAIERENVVPLMSTVNTSANL